MAMFMEHAGKCPRCRNDYEVEQITKSVVHHRVKMVRTPGAVMERVAGALRKEAETPLREQTFSGRLRNFIESAYFRPAIGFAAACIIVILLLQTSNPGDGPVQASLLSGDVIRQSMSNYKAVVSGQISPQVTSDRADMVSSFFTGKTEFPVLVPKLKRCSLIGGVLNEFAGVKLGHVVYKLNSEVVYMYQACWNEVQSGKRIHLPAEARAELERTGWYSATQPDGYSIVLWTKGRTLCSAVAHMPVEELVACVSDQDTTGTAPW